MVHLMKFLKYISREEACTKHGLKLVEIKTLDYTNKMDSTLTVVFLS